MLSGQRPGTGGVGQISHRTARDDYGHGGHIGRISGDGNRRHGCGWGYTRHCCRTPGKPRRTGARPGNRRPDHQRASKSRLAQKWKRAIYQINTRISTKVEISIGAIPSSSRWVVGERRVANIGSVEAIRFFRAQEWPPVRLPYDVQALWRALDL